MNRTLILAAATVLVGLSLAPATLAGPGAADYAVMAKEALSKGKAGRAASHAKRALRKTDQIAIVRHASTTLCLAQMEIGEDYVDACQDSVDIDNANWRAWNNLATAQYKAGDYGAAAASYRTAMDLDGADRDLLAANLAMAERQVMLASR